MNSITIHIPGPPVGKERARVTANGTYTPEKTRDWEEKARHYMRFAMAAHGHNEPLSGPVRVFIVAAFRPSVPNTMRLPHTATPDRDNVEKAVQDAGNRLVWTDDKLVWSGLAECVWASDGEPEGVTIKVVQSSEISTWAHRLLDLGADLVGKGGAA